MACSLGPCHGLRHAQAYAPGVCLTSAADTLQFVGETATATNAPMIIHYLWDTVRAQRLHSAGDAGYITRDIQRILQTRTVGVEPRSWDSVSTMRQARYTRTPMLTVFAQHESLARASGVAVGSVPGRKGNAGLP